MSTNLLIIRVTQKLSKFIPKDKCLLFAPRTIRGREMSSTAGDDDLTSRPGLLTILEKSPKRFDRIKFLGKLFNNAGFELRIAGGAVRDILRGVEPQDIDFATTARPEQSLEILKKHEDILRIIVTAAGQKHGTVAVKFKETNLDLKRIKLDNRDGIALDQNVTNDKPEYDDENPFEITTLRCDNVTDGRHAEVQFINDWKMDAERRDLTINAMFLTLDNGKLIDYFGGESDLSNGIVRFVGDADLRIKEDYLRILRFFRFWLRYGRSNPPDDITLKTIRTNMDGLDRISGERIWQEMKKTLAIYPCLEVVNLMLKTDLYSHIGLDDGNLSKQEYIDTVLKEVEKTEIHIQEYLKYSSEYTCGDDKLDKKVKELLPVIMFSCLVLSPEMCINSYNRMKFSNLERDSILYIINNRTNSVVMEKLKYDLALAHVPERSAILIKMRGYLISKGNFEALKELLSWTIPNFPIAGSIVAQESKKRKIPSDKIKTIIETLKHEWAESNFQLNSKDLELRMFAKLDKLASSNIKND